MAGSAVCRIRLLGSGDFDFKCGTPISHEGSGSYRQEGDRLILSLERVSSGGRVREIDSAEITFRVSGPGNELTLERTGLATPVRWRRTLR